MATQSATQTTWKIDAAHTLVEFSAKHMMVTTVKGRFREFEGLITLDEKNLANSSVEVQINAASIDTGNDQRNAHLKSADFLDVEKYPTITFKSTKVELDSDERAKITGDLTIRDMTHPIVLEAELTGFGRTPFKTEVVGFDAEAKLNRKDWGLTWNVPLEKGGFLVGDTLKVSLSVQGVKQE
jgi:polyisoprenoid-binding protein YceI